MVPFVNVSVGIHGDEDGGDGGKELIQLAVRPFERFFRFLLAGDVEKNSVHPFHVAAPVENDLPSILNPMDASVHVPNAVLPDKASSMGQRGLQSFFHPGEILWDNPFTPPGAAFHQFVGRASRELLDTGGYKINGPILLAFVDHARHRMDQNGVFLPLSFDLLRLCGNHPLQLLAVPLSVSLQRQAVKGTFDDHLGRYGTVRRSDAAVHVQAGNLGGNFRALF